MEHDNSPQRFEVVDGPLAAQHRWTGDQAFTGSDRHLRTGGISMGSLRPCHVLPRAQAASSGPMVERTEEQALVHVVAADIEERANVLLRQLEDTDHRSAGKSLPFYFLPSFFYISFLIVNGISCVRGDRGARGSSYCGRCLPGLPGGRLRSYGGPALGCTPPCYHHHRERRLS
jgi:hypothetical protein